MQISTWQCIASFEGHSNGGKNYFSGVWRCQIHASSILKVAKKMTPIQWAMPSSGDSWQWTLLGISIRVAMHPQGGDISHLTRSGDWMGSSCKYSTSRGKTQRLQSVLQKECARWKEGINFLFFNVWLQTRTMWENALQDTTHWRILNCKMLVRHSRHNTNSLYC